MGRTRWTVRLAPRRGLPGEYLGVGERETRDDEGRIVTMEIGAVREKGDFRAWLGPAIITCKGAYRVDKAIEGDCIEMDGDAAGRFRAERVARSTR